LPDVGELSTRNLIDFETGHYKIRSANYDTDFPYSLSNLIVNYEDIEDGSPGRTTLRVTPSASTSSPKRIMASIRWR
jgi:hypothetical protein